MASEVVREVITALESGDRTTAHQLATAAIRANPRDESAWMILSMLAEERQYQVDCLLQVLTINPDNQWALERLARRGIPVPEPALASPDLTIPDKEVEWPTAFLLDPAAAAVEETSTSSVGPKVARAIVEEAGQPAPQVPAPAAEPAPGLTWEEELLFDPQFTASQAPAPDPPAEPPEVRGKQPAWLVALRVGIPTLLVALLVLAGMLLASAIGTLLNTLR